VRDTTAVTDAGPTVDEVVDHLWAAFRPQEGQPSDWPARDLTFGQLKTLFMLRRDGPLSIGRVAEAFGIGAAAASGYVERIERHGLIERRHRTDDRRVVECHLTESGGKLLDDMAGGRAEAMRRALSVLTPEELADFDRLITIIAARTAAAI
jgi:DNA-binding MarR family transcriptional regulator